MIIHWIHSHSLTNYKSQTFISLFVSQGPSLRWRIQRVASAGRSVSRKSRIWNLTTEEWSLQYFSSVKTLQDYDYEFIWPLTVIITAQTKNVFIILDSINIGLFMIHFVCFYAIWFCHYKWTQRHIRLFVAHVCFPN